jgi:hypothetical protein
VYGVAPSGKGVYGNSANGTGVYGAHTATNGTNPGVRGDSASSTANSYGVWGSHNGGSGGGVFGSTTGFSFGVVGASQGFDGILGLAGTTTNPHTNGGYLTAVWGDGGTGASGVVGTTNNSFPAVFGTTASGTGVSGASSTGTGVNGFSSGGNGVEGSSGTGYAGYFGGNVRITGTCCSAPTNNVEIDDPLDPAHKYLQHSLVASSQQLDMYSGNVTTNRKGFATVTMPRWFQALNRSFRYQLTPVGHSAWGAQAIVWNPINGNRFTIRSKPGVEVSWQVTAVRHDRYANANPVRVIVSKPKADQGKYLNPQLYGKPTTDGIGYQRPPRAPRISIHKR